MKNSNTPSSTAPVEVLAETCPGEIEASAIREDYEIARRGLRAYVRMGFRLAAVKAALPHGKFLPWCGEYLADISPRHLQNAKMCAESLCEMAQIKCETRFAFDELPEEILAMVDASSGQRALMTTVHEFRADEAEQAAEARCREFFAGDPDLADEWEPRVLSGEITWCQAVRGIAGHAATAGKRRKETNYGLLLPTTLTTLNNAFRKWETIPESRRAEVAVSLRTMARDWPEDVRQIIRQAI